MVANLFHIPFRYFPVTTETKEHQEQHVLAAFREHQVDLVVMGRYMQIVSERILQEVGCPVLYVHHSFLPAFVWAKP